MNADLKRDVANQLIDSSSMPQPLGRFAMRQTNGANLAVILNNWQALLCKLSKGQSPLVVVSEVTT